MAKAGTVVIELKKRTSTADAGILYLRVSVGGGKPYERGSLTYSIPVKSWDEINERVLRSHPNADDINEDIARQKAQLEEEIKSIRRAGKEITNSTISRLFAKGNGEDFISFWREYMTFLRAPRKGKGGEESKYSYNHIKKMQSELNRLEDYTDGQLRFSEINKKWLEQYELSCAKTLDPQTSLAQTMGKLKQMLKRAEDDGLYSASQSKGYLWPVYVNPDRPYLTLAETEKISALLYRGDFDSDIALKTVTAYFLVECYCGIRFSDWGRFKVEKLIDREAVKVRAKKNGEPVYFPIDNSPRLKKILALIKDEDLTVNFTEQHANRLLKILAGNNELKLDIELTTHIGRHTAGTLLLEMGYSDSTVAEILGISLRTVAIYAKMTRRKIMNEYDKIGGL